MPLPCCLLHTDLRGRGTADRLTRNTNSSGCASMLPMLMEWRDWSRAVQIARRVGATEVAPYVPTHGSGPD